MAARIALVAALILGGLLAARPQALAADDAAKPVDELARAFFAEHCQACHVGEKPKGKFRLDGLSSDFLDKTNRERWLAVLERVKAGTMPPKEKPPSAGARSRGPDRLDRQATIGGAGRPSG